MWKQWSYGRSALLRCKRACRWAFATEPSLANCAEIVRNEFAQSTVAREKEPTSEGLGGGAKKIGPMVLVTMKCRQSVQRYAATFCGVARRPAKIGPTTGISPAGCLLSSYFRVGHYSTATLIKNATQPSHRVSPPSRA